MKVRKTKRKIEIKDGKWPNFPVSPDKCLLIQWERESIPVDPDGHPVCPHCGEPAEFVLGVFGNPCYAHKPRERRRR